MEVSGIEVEASVNFVKTVCGEELMSEMVCKQTLQQLGIAVLMLNHCVCKLECSDGPHMAQQQAISLMMYLSL